MTEGPAQPSQPAALAESRAKRFTEERPRLLGLAYRMIGSRVDAEDITQEAWLRYSGLAPDAEPDNRAAWLTTVTSRLALDRLRSAAHRRERYVGPWLPEPIRTHFGPDWEPATTGAPEGGSATGTGASTDGAPGDPAEVVDRAATLTLGFLVVLDALSPEDRAVFLLADVFAVPFAEVAGIVGRSPEACRQAASRARRRLRQAGPPRPAGPTAADWDLAARFAAAVAESDLDATLRLLSPEVTLVSDGGADRHAARRPVVGAEKVARFLVNLSERRPDGMTIELAEMNASPALISRFPDQAPVVWVVETASDGRIGALRVVGAPEKVAALDADPLW